MLPFGLAGALDHGRVVDVVAAAQLQTHLNGLAALAAATYQLPLVFPLVPVFSPGLAVREPRTTQEGPMKTVLNLRQYQ